MDRAIIGNSFDLTEDEQKIVRLCYAVVGASVPMPGSNLMRIITKLHDRVKFLEASAALYEPEDLAEQRVKTVVREMKQESKFDTARATAYVDAKNKLQDRYGNK